MSKKAAFFMHLSISLFAVAADEVPKAVPAEQPPKKLIELDEAGRRALLSELKAVKQLEGEVDPVLEAGEYIELQNDSDLMHVDPNTHLVHDSVSRCQLRVDYSAYKALAEKQKRTVSDGLILSRFYTDNSTTARLLKLNGPAVATWESPELAIPFRSPATPNKLILTYPIDDSRGLVKELVCSYTSDEKDIGSYEELQKVERILKDRVLQTDLTSTFRNLDRLRFLTAKEGRISDPVIGDGEKAKDKAILYKDHI